MNKKIIEGIESALKELAERQDKTGHCHNLVSVLQTALALAQEGDALRAPAVKEKPAKKSAE